MTSYAVRVVRWSIVALVGVACAKGDQPGAGRGAADSVTPAPPAPPVAAAAAVPTPDSAATARADSAASAASAVSAVSGGVAIPKPASSAASSPRPSGPSTRAGIYTAEQANRGKQVYAGSCRSCHSPTSHTGQVFVDWWQNKRLSDLYNYIAAQMPKNDPGTLAPEDVVDVVAYLLKMNDMPAGRTELYPDADSLKKFWIDARPGK